MPHQDLGLQIAHGPLSIVIGLAAGILLGLVCALTPVWSSAFRRAAALLVMGELMAFCGCVQCLSFQILAAHLVAVGMLAIRAAALCVCVVEVFGYAVLCQQ